MYFFLIVLRKLFAWMIIYPRLPSYSFQSFHFWVTPLIHLLNLSITIVVVFFFHLMRLSSLILQLFFCLLHEERDMTIFYGWSMIFSFPLHLPFLLLCQHDFSIDCSLHFQINYSILLRNSIIIFLWIIVPWLNLL